MIIDVTAWDKYLELALWIILALTATVFAFRGLQKPAEDDLGGRVEYDTSYLKKAAVGFLAGAVVLATIVLVPAGHRGVIFSQTGGVIQEELPEGIGIIVPFWQRAELLDVRIKVFPYESFVQTQDLQEVTLPIAVNYHIDPSRAAQLYQEVGSLAVAEQTIIEPAAFQASTQAAGQVVAEDIAFKRQELAESVTAIMAPQLSRHGIVIEYVAVKDAVFDTDFIAAIKAKVIAQEKALEQERLIRAKEAQARQKVAKAQGEAEAIIIVADAKQQEIEAVAAALGFTPEEYLRWLRVQTWDGQLPVTLLTADGEFIIGLE